MFNIKRHIILFILLMGLLTSCTNIKIEIPKDIINIFEVENQEDIDKENIQNEELIEKKDVEELETSKELLEMENEMINLVNKEREKNGLNKLELDKGLRNIARIKSKDISENDYFDHTSPTYGTPFEMMDQFGISFTQAAENLAGHQSVKLAHEGLMNSKGHRENILTPTLTHIGIGIERDNKYGFVFTQMFITKN